MIKFLRKSFVITEIIASGPSLHTAGASVQLFREEKKTVPENLFATAEVSLQPMLLKSRSTVYIYIYVLDLFHPMYIYIYIYPLL